MEKKWLWIVVLLALAIIAQYFLWSSLIDEDDNKITEAAQFGYDRGVEDIVNTLINETKNCKTTTVFSENNSVTLIDAKCSP